MPESVLAVVFAVAGVVAKSLWDQLMARRADRLKRSSEARIGYLEAQLSKLYWPLYMGLMRDNALWPHVERRSSANPEQARVGWTLEEKVTLPNHAAMVAIIEANLHLAAGDPEVLDQLQRYVRHVAVYQALRAAGLKDKDPVAQGEPWPGNLFPVIEKRTLALQGEYNRLLEESRAVV